jgi:membrane dipeptidase
MIYLSKEEEERVSAIHSKAIVIDTHNDTILDLMKGAAPAITSKENIPYREFSLQRRLGERSDKGHIDIPRIREGGVDCLFFAMYVSPTFRARLRRLTQMLDVFYSEIEDNHDQIILAKNYEAVIDAKKKGKIAAILTVEGGEPLEEDVGTLRILYKLGVRSLTLTHFPRNELGDGSGSDSGSHLTDFGSRVVEEMNRLGMIIDVSHINETGFWDILEKTRSPVIASHSNCRALCSFHRNLSDDQIKALANNGGVINLSYCAPFIKEGLGDFTPEKANRVVLEDWFSHLEHAVKIVGPDHVGLGSDFDGGCGFPGMDSITKVPQITRGLVKRGYADEDIEKILGGNNLRVMKKVLT